MRIRRKNIDMSKAFVPVKKEGGLPKSHLLKFMSRSTSKSHKSTLFILKGKNLACFGIQINDSKYISNSEPLLRDSRL